MSEPVRGSSDVNGNVNERHNDASFIIADTKLKDFPDFDDDKKAEENEIPGKGKDRQKVVDVEISKPRRRENMLNGVVLTSNVGEFDVVGGADLFNNHPESMIDDEFLADEQKIVPGLGEGGTPVTLTGDEAAMATELMKKEAFNIIASDKVSLSRIKWLAFHLVAYLDRISVKVLQFKSFYSIS